MRHVGRIVWWFWYASEGSQADTEWADFAREHAVLAADEAREGDDGIDRPAAPVCRGLFSEAPCERASKHWQRRMAR